MSDTVLKGLKLRQKITEILQNVMGEPRYEAYLVGGCVRDLYLGIEPKDVDIATNCPMQLLKSTFKTTSVGEKFGTLLVHFEGEQFEVTQFRSEKYSGTRKPETTFGGTIEEDLSRRDFTINAVAWDGHKYIDPFGGLKDILDKQMRFVGNAQKRIEEDPLRIMRWVRFMARFMLYSRESETKTVRENLHLLKTLSAERIREELNKGIMLERADIYFEMLYVSGVLEKVLPEVHEAFEFRTSHTKSLMNHMIRCVQDGTDYVNLKVRWAALLHDIGKPDTYEYQGGRATFTNHNVVGARIIDKMMRRLKFSNDTREFVVNATDRHMGTFNDFTDKGIRKLYEVFGKDLPLFLEVKMADYIGHQNTNIGKFKYKMRQMAQVYTKVIDYMHRVIEKEQAFKMSDLAINGNTLIDLGYTPGPQFKVILNDCMDMVLEGKLKNNADTLETYVCDNY